MPRVSVVMPVRNALPYFDEAVESIRAQTFSDWELLIIDDHSTDGSTEAAYTYAEKDPRIRVLHNDGNGAGAARNTGMKAASGELIAMMDADDISLPQRLERQVVFLDAHPRVAMVGTHAQRFGKEDWVCRGYTSNAMIRATILFRTSFIVATIMLRRSVKETYPTMAYGEDNVFCHKIALKHPVANLPEALYRYRIHDASTSFNVDKTVYLRQFWREVAPLRLGFVPSEQEIDAIMGWNGQMQVEPAKQRKFALKALLRGRYSLRERAILAAFLLWNFRR